MPYYDMIDFKGNGSSIAPAPPAGATQDATNFNGPYFFGTDFLLPETDQSVIALGSGGLFGYGLTNTFSTPCGYGPTDLLNHPGICWVSTGSAGSVGSMTMRTTGFTNNNSFTIYTGTPTTSFTYIFKTPPVVNSGPDSYNMAIGPMISSSVATIANRGWSALYTNASSSWVFQETSNGVVITSANTGVPFQANTWMRLSIVVNPSNIVAANMTVCGTVTTTGNQIFNGSSPILAGGNGFPIVPMGMGIFRVTSTGPTIGFACDYMSMTIATTGRVW